MEGGSGKVVTRIYCVHVCNFQRIFFKVTKMKDFRMLFYVEWLLWGKIVDQVGNKGFASMQFFWTLRKQIKLTKGWGTSLLSLRMKTWLQAHPKMPTHLLTAVTSLLHVSIPSSCATCCPPVGAIANSLFLWSVICWCHRILPRS